jgi:hypothetical protein
MTEVVLPARFNGPPASANGGYACGTVAQLLGDAPAQVRLHRPPPLDTPLQWTDGRLFDGPELIAEATPFAGDEVDIPQPVSLELATAASAGFRGLTVHPFPSCFGCGTDRAPGDGLRIFAGPLRDHALVAAPWEPHPSLAVDGAIPTAVVWAALDCPGGWAVPDDTTRVLGTMRGHVVRRVEPGERLVASAWPLGVTGRKCHTGSALRDAAGGLVGWSHQIWIEVR